VHYIEQPTHRDLKAHPENRMHAAAKIKPVVIDESLVDFESLLLCREMGYSGVALKACKGHSEALLMGAAAQKYGMFLCVQDLTCPGSSGVIVGAAGITIDLKGFTLTGDRSASHYGALDGSYSHVKVENGAVRNFYDGIDAGSSTTAVTVSNVVVSGSVLAGIFICCGAGWWRAGSL